jgi:hypothetical protein
MFEEPSRVGVYLDKAATLRRMADNSPFPEIRTRLLGLAVSFERLARAVEVWENDMIRLYGSS